MSATRAPPSVLRTSGSPENSRAFRRSAPARGYPPWRPILCRAGCLRASRAGEGQEPRRGQASLDLGHLSLAAHEAAPRGGQVGARGLACSAGAQNTLFGRPAPRGAPIQHHSSNRPDALSRGPAFGAHLSYKTPPLRLPSSGGDLSGRNHSETWAGCSVSSITAARSLFRVSRSVSSRSLAENASTVFLASYLRL